MLQRKGSRFELYPHKVKYNQNGEEIEQWALPNKKWWLDFAVEWGHTEIIEFTEIELTEEQLARFEEIKDMPEDFMDMYVEYILTGNLQTDFKLPNNHPFNILRLQKSDAGQSDYLLDVDFRLIMVELGL